MSGISELAMMLKARENTRPYAPMFGIITELPDLKIRISEKVILNADNHVLKYCFPIYETDSDGKYIHQGREVVLLPYDNEQKYIVIGVVM